MFHCSVEFVAILNHSYIKKMFTNVNKADVHNFVGFYDFSRSFNRDFFMVVPI